LINWEDIKRQLQIFLKSELEKTGLKRVTVGLSGGLDSAVVAVLCKETFGDNMSAVLMPSQFSSKESVEDAIELCEKFDIKYEIKSIASMVDAYIDNMDEDRLRIGNYSARMRMSVLYDTSSRDSSIVVGTSNKSELLLGYGTIFGDIACAINPIGQMYKSDEEELGYSYKEMDTVLKLIVDEKKTKEEIISLGHDEKLIDTLEYRMKTNAFKGKLPIIANIKWS